MLLRLVILLVFLIMLISLLFGRRCLVGFKAWKRASKVERETLALMQAPEDPKAFIERIPEIAERHRRQMEESFGEKLSYAKSDLARLDAIIDKAWGKELPKNTDVLVLTFGAFFGETLRRLRGGFWAYEEGRGFCLQDVGGLATVFPFEKVSKRFQDSKAHSLALFYRALVKTVEKGE